MPAGALPVRRAKTLEQCFIFLKDDGGEPLLPLKAVVWTTPYRIHNLFLVKAVCTHGAANPQQGKQRRLGAARRGAHRGGEASGCLGPVFAPRDGRVGQGGGEVGDHAGLPGSIQPRSLSRHPASTLSLRRACGGLERENGRNGHAGIFHNTRRRGSTPHLAIFKKTPPLLPGSVSRHCKSSEAGRIISHRVFGFCFEWGGMRACGEEKATSVTQFFLKTQVSQ